jgi:hypothetical protein
MKCGNCKKQHADASEVRDCYADAGKIGNPMRDRFTDSGLQPVTDGPQWPPSDRQIAYIMSLQEQKIAPQWWKPLDEATARKLEKDEASGVIQMLKSFADNKATDSGKADYRDVPAGRYALQMPGPDGHDVWRFFEVQDGKGKWKGYKFIKRLIGSPGQYQKAQMSREDRMVVMKRLEADPDQAMTDYGLQSGVCGKCHSPLTNPESLARGIGPVCLRKLGW